MTIGVFNEIGDSSVDCQNCIAFVIEVVGALGLSPISKGLPGRHLNSRVHALILHVPEFVDQHADVFAVVDRNRNQVQPAGGKCVLQRRRQA